MLIVMETLYGKNIKPENVPPGHWMAIFPSHLINSNNGDQEVISHGINLEQVVNAARRCGIERPLVHKQLDHLTINEKYKEKYLEPKKDE